MQTTNQNFPYFLKNLHTNPPTSSHVPLSCNGKWCKYFDSSISQDYYLSEDQNPNYIPPFIDDIIPPSQELIDYSNKQENKIILPIQPGDNNFILLGDIFNLSDDIIDLNDILYPIMDILYKDPQIKTVITTSTNFGFVDSNTGLPTPYKFALAAYTLSTEHFDITTLNPCMQNEFKISSCQSYNPTQIWYRNTNLKTTQPTHYPTNEFIQWL